MRHAFAISIGAILSIQPASAAGKGFSEFVLEQAHDRSFTQCDTAIRDAYSLASGQDIRVITYSIPGTDGLKIVAVWGKAGDVIHQESQFRKVGATCVFSYTATITQLKSCAAVLGENPAFKFVAETAGVVFTKNSGGMDMLLSPVGPQACMITYIRDGRA